MLSGDRQTLPANEAEQQGDHRSAAEAGGFSLHAGIDIQPHQRARLERLCRYLSRPPVAAERLARYRQAVPSEIPTNMTGQRVPIRSKLLRGSRVSETEVPAPLAIHKLKETHTATHPARLPPVLTADRAAGHARQTAAAALAGGRRAD